MRRRGRRDCGLGRRGPHFEVAGVSRQGWGPGLVSKGEATEAPARPLQPSLDLGEVRGLVGDRARDVSLSGLPPQRRACGCRGRGPLSLLSR